MTNGDNVVDRPADDTFDRVLMLSSDPSTTSRICVFTAARLRSNRAARVADADIDRACDAAVVEMS